MCVRVEEWDQGFDFGQYVPGGEAITGGDFGRRIAQLHSSASQYVELIICYYLV